MRFQLIPANNAGYPMYINILMSPGLSTRVLKFNAYTRPLQRSMSFSSPGSSSPAASSSPPTPRPSASLIIINERNEILLVRRNPKATIFGGMHVRVYLFKGARVI